MDAFSNIEDMSINGSMDWHIATIFVGSERRAFQVHVKRLGPLAAQLRTLSGDIEKPDWDADVFNLVMNWTWFSQGPGLTAADKFTPYIERESATSAVYAHFHTITVQAPYRRFSIEELRLQFSQAAANTQASRDEATDQPIVQSENTPGTQTQSVDQESVDCNSTSSCPTIPACIPDTEAVKAEKGQTLLFKLMIFTEKFGWERLFNDAIDAFRYGEEQLGRLYVPASYIDFAFLEPRSIMVQCFVSRYVVALGYKHSNMSKYKDLILSHPEILSYILRSIDSGIFPGFDYINNFTRKTFTSPTIPPHTTYHIHNGKLILACNYKRGRDNYSS
ncbi:hypothetical protein GGR58DRAFT_526011 [Xylaria digitata]|nr:hypothetical protein GGR58DRAFT_526011 [Xylaria digitata]